MKLCDTCIYRNNVEQLKPCIIYRDDCEHYEREEDMKAIIQIDVPDHQIGQEVSIYFKDTMMIKGIVQEPSDDSISRQAVLDVIEELKKIHFDRVVVLNKVRDRVLDLPPINPQEPKTGHWKSFTHSAYHGIDDDGEPIWREVKVYHCNLCNRRTVIKENFCPNCGARMESGE